MTNKSIADKYQQLSAPEKLTLQALAIYPRDVSLGDLTKLLREVHKNEPDLWRELPKQSAVRDALERLEKAKFAEILTRSMSRIRVAYEVLDFCLQQAVVAGRFADLDRMMRQQKSIALDSMESLRSWSRHSNMHEFFARSAFYQGHTETFFAVCDLANITEDRATQLDLMTSWEPQVFQGLPAPLQREALIGTLTRSIVDGIASDESIQQFKLLVFSDDPAALAWADLRVQWLAVAGDIEQLTKIAKSDSPARELAAGCGAFLQGNCELAKESFQKHVAIASKSDPRATPILPDVAGLMQLFLILKEDSSNLRRSLKSYFGLMKKHGFKSYFFHFEFVVALVDYSVSMEAPARQKLASKLKEQWDCELTTTQVFTAHLWRWFIPDHPFSFSVESRALAQWNRDHGLLWLAAICEDALSLGIRSPDGQLQPRQPLGTSHKELGTFPMADWIEQQPVWKQKLEVLRQVADKQSNRQSKVAEESFEHDERMAWELDLKVAKTQVKISGLRPVIQKRSGKAWTKGRPIALHRLHGPTRDKSVNYLTPQDTAICRAIEAHEVSTGYYRYTETQYDFNLEQAMEALIGHPTIFPPDDRSCTLELVSREPELVIEEWASGYRLSLSPAPSGEETVFLHPDGQHRFAVIRFTPAQSQLSKVLGRGIEVPVSAQAELLATAQSLSNVAAVQSAVPLMPADGASTSSAAEQNAAQNVTASSAPLVHLTPCQEGIRAEFFVRPFGTQGPLFSPGVGGQSIFTVIDGQRLVTHRDLAAEQQRVADVTSRCPSLAGSLEAFVAAVDLPTAEQALELISEIEPLHEQGLVTVCWPQGQRLRVAGQADCQQLRINLKSDKDWFAASGELVIDKQSAIDLVQLAELISSRPSAFIPLSDGRFLRLSEQLRQRVAALSAFSDRRGNTLRFPPIRAAAMEDMDQWCKLKSGKAWKECQQRIREALETNFPLPSTLNATLRDYQLEGFQWLCRLAHWGAGACLADDMGLGKTLQAIALLLHRATGGPALVVAPTSLGFNWENELYRFAPTLRPHIFGSGNRDTQLADLGPRDVLITSYGLLQNDSKRFTAIDWHTVVLDEAQAIKNMATKRSQAAMELPANFRLILTGTPIENHLGELWNLMQFINPGLLGSSEQFQQRFAIPIERDHNREIRQQLKRLVQPFLLRRTKSQVLTELPSRTEVTLTVTLSDDEALLYEAARLRAVAELAAAAESKQGQHVRILAELMRLRRACCHPRLLLPECELPGSKLEAFSQTIDELIENQHKALVFSQFVDHLKILREELDRKGITYQYLDGSTPAKERRRRVEAFQNGEGDVFLISLKAGGTGLNLTAADYVLHMDPWWNPAVEDQAADRAHRIGQQRPVTIYRFITRGTIEEKIVELHKNKRDLADSLLEGTDATGRLTADELLKLIQP